MTDSQPSLTPATLATVLTTDATPGAQAILATAKLYFDNVSLLCFLMDDGTVNAVFRGKQLMFADVAAIIAYYRENYGVNVGAGATDRNT